MARIPLAVALLAMVLPAAPANAARYVAEPEAGGQIAFELERGRLRSAEATLPARCENNHGGSWSADLSVALTGDLALRAGRFRIEGRADNDVRYEIRGKRRSGAITGRVWLTYLDIDHVGVGVDDSFLCDTGRTRYRATRE
jgi:hypothetical protein